VSARILFVCTGNSARSQMAEGLARALAAPDVEVASAGTHPAGVSPFAVAALRERGLDISSQRSKRIEDVPGEFDYVITLCDSAARECPVLSARRRRLHWSVMDPGTGGGDDEQLLARFRQIRDDLERRLRKWLHEEKLLRESAAEPLAEKVRAELARYEHPLFNFEAYPGSDGVQVQIKFHPPAEAVHTYAFLLRPREIENQQFPWIFQKQLYDCLHDYIIEMFTRNPQREN